MSRFRSLCSLHLAEYSDKLLAKIEAMISDLTERYSKGAFHIREALHNAKAAVAHAKEAVLSHVSSEKAKRFPVKRKKAAVRKAAIKTPTATRAKKAAPARKKAAVKRATARPAIAKTAKKNAPIKRPVKKAAAKKTAPAPVQAGTKSAAQVPIGK